jgi:hypothetical protein
MGLKYAINRYVHTNVWVGKKMVFFFFKASFEDDDGDF